MDHDEIEKVGRVIVDSSIQVHRTMGPGLLESIYEECLIKELRSRGMKLRSQVATPLRYNEELLKEYLWIDLLVEDLVVVELKSLKSLHPVHKMQLLSYLRLSGKKLGFLINFNVPLLKEGVHRIVNEL